MTGELIKAITLTTYGTAFLKDDYNISGLTLEHPSFIFTNKVEFQHLKKYLIFKPKWHIYADSPVMWLTKLKEAGCKEIRLVFLPDNQRSLNGETIPDHKLAGFVGGGGYRFIETVFPNHSDFWQSREKVTDRDAPDSKIWKVTYRRILTGKQTLKKEIYDIDSLKKKLKSKLISISAFAKGEKLTFWSEWFDKAINLIDASIPFVNDRDRLIIPTDKMDLNSIQLFASAKSAWCFGGMGSWNDIGFNDNNTQNTYDKLTAELYDIVNESYLAVANSCE